MLGTMTLSGSGTVWKAVNRIRYHWNLTIMTRSNRTFEHVSFFERSNIETVSIMIIIGLTEHKLIWKSSAIKFIARTYFVLWSESTTEFSVSSGRIWIFNDWIGPKLIACWTLYNVMSWTITDVVFRAISWIFCVRNYFNVLKKSGIKKKLPGKCPSAVQIKLSKAFVRHAALFIGKFPVQKEYKDPVFLKQ